jgi:hypothetical protein
VAMHTRVGSRLGHTTVGIEGARSRERLADLWCKASR